MERDFDVFHEEMEAKGIRLFAGGLRPKKDAKPVRAQRDGKALVADGHIWDERDWRVSEAITARNR